MTIKPRIKIDENCERAPNNENGTADTNQPPTKRKRNLYFKREKRSSKSRKIGNVQRHNTSKQLKIIIANK